VWAKLHCLGDDCCLLVCREDLARPAQTLFLHNLTGILETAIRATNAQFDDADILRRLDVRLLEVGTHHPCFIGVFDVHLYYLHVIFQACVGCDLAC